MRQIIRPTDTAGDVFAECISLVRNPGLRRRLNDVKNLVIQASEELDQKVTTGNLHTIIRETLVNGNVTAKELENVYTIRMVPKSSPGRKIYDKIKISAPFGICPLCAHREVKTIDHYLPKTKYPRLAVAPLNLLPACTDCNDIKDVFYPTKASEEFIHPYYDDVEDDLWLYARIEQTTPATIQFYVQPPDHWSELLKERVEYHFDKLNLNALYSVQAAVELNNINYGLSEIFSSSGVNGVKEHLLKQSQARSQANINSWQTAMYTAMSTDNWFCNGGFQTRVI